MRKIILRWVIRPPTKVHQDEDVFINEDHLWKRILSRLKEMGLIREGQDDKEDT